MTWLDRLDFVPEASFSVNDILTRLRRQDDQDALTQEWVSPEVVKGDVLLDTWEDASDLEV